MKYFALYTFSGSLLTFDPFHETFSEIGTRYSELKIWDVQFSGDDSFWFMGKNVRPGVAFEIREIPTELLKEVKFIDE